MQCWEKITGMIVALMMDDSLQGVVLGLLIGHMFGKAHSHKMAWFTNRCGHQALFSATTFEVMGHLTKSKGHVTEVDIHVIDRLIDRVNLRGASHTAAQNTFRAGKSGNYPPREKVHRFCSVCFGRLGLIHMFLKVQIRTAFADGLLHPNERVVLHVIAEELEISRAQFDQFLRMMRGGAQLGDDYQQQSDGGSWQQTRRDPTLEDACNVSSVKSTGDATTIRCACCRLMSERYPDKLVAKGLPPKMMEMVKQKTQEIQQTYELVKQQKGFK